MMRGKDTRRGVRGEDGWRVQVRAEAHLDPWMEDFLGGLTLTHQGDGTTILRGELEDMAAVYGCILQLRDAGVVLLSLQVNRISSY